ncbi:hypothetical protein DEIPH_ctg139orf0109 [Deinococcus phoenicis]|uniref:PEGA domain-containing protein n=1 Tax=Deinococcus phoenicis TaxID=1476583 RepID=A0A016QJY7_9DEIO|nr:carboxypeptidase-like regulatory domain-containing protein [Deinococcus phoenicis]EYB66383.1 hypothetical protein DEIPH_ctg139orf0109 [Deinococcus phoenicis]
MSNGMNVGKSSFGSFFKNWGSDPAPTPGPQAAPTAAVQPDPVPSPVQEPPVAPTTPVPDAPALLAPPAAVPPPPAPAAPPPAAPEAVAEPLPPAPEPQSPAPEQRAPADEADDPEGTDEEEEEGVEEESGETAPTEVEEAASVPEARDAPELPTPTGEVFGYLASLMSPGSALAFTLSLGEDGRLTAQVKPLNLPALPELTLTGTVKEFDSAELLYALREYRPAVQGGLRDQARSQARAVQTKATAPTKPASPSPALAAASDRNKGKLRIAVDVPGTTLKATLGGHGISVQVGENDLTPGRYTVEASAEGYKAAKQTVKVERGKTADLAFTLGGTLTVHAPGGAAVTVLDAAGNPVNSAGPLPEGMYKVLVEAEHKKPFTWHGTVKAGPPTQVTATLDDAPPTLFGS